MGLDVWHEPPPSGLEALAQEHGGELAHRPVLRAAENLGQDDDDGVLGEVDLERLRGLHVTQPDAGYGRGLRTEHGPGPGLGRSMGWGSGQGRERCVDAEPKAFVESTGRPAPCPPLGPSLCPSSLRPACLRPCPASLSPCPYLPAPWPALGCPNVRACTCRMTAVVGCSSCSSSASTSATTCGCRPPPIKPQAGQFSP